MTESLPLINCTFPTERLLYSAYMPYIKNGGLFIKTKQFYPLGTKIQLQVTLLDEVVPYVIDGQIAWITPKAAQNDKPLGLGIQFSCENTRMLRNKIETYLSEMLKLSQPTDTI